MSEFGPEPGPGDMETRPLPNEPHGKARSAAKKTAMSGGRLQPPETEPVITLSAAQKMYLFMHIQEVPQKDIRTNLGLTEYKYATFQKELWNTLGADSVLSAILIAINREGIPREEVLEGFDRQRYLALTATDKETLEKVTENFGRGFSQRQAADDLRISQRAFERRLRRVNAKLGTGTQEHAAALYMASAPPSAGEITEGLVNKLEEHPEKLTDRDIQILLLRAKGQKNQEIAANLDTTVTAVKSRFTEIFKTLEADTAVQAIVHAIHLEILNPHDIIEDHTVAIISELDDNETLVMDAMTAAGSNGTNKTITEITGLGNTKINELISTTGLKLRTNNRFHSAAVYAAAKKLQAA